MKQKMSNDDIRAIITEVSKKIITYRLANIYDLQATKSFVLKFARADVPKVYVVIESGSRIHTTKYEREKNKTPQNFVAQLRKFIRTRRVEKVEQLGVDRVVDFTFGSDEKAYHLIVEFYAQGNIVLTDHEYNILALLRVHSKEEDVEFKPGEKYPVEKRKIFKRITEESLKNILENEDKTKPNKLSKIFTGSIGISNIILKTKTMVLAS
jgi:predicted ribosome quality control (RQC) complex YloA/Tae2 family protein